MLHTLIVFNLLSLESHEQRSGKTRGVSHRQSRTREL